MQSIGARDVGKVAGYGDPVDFTCEWHRMQKTRVRAVGNVDDLKAISLRSDICEIVPYSDIICWPR